MKEFTANEVWVASIGFLILGIVFGLILGSLKRREP
jgi:hypothetical protein